MYICCLKELLILYSQAVTLAAGLRPKVSGILIGPVENLAGPVEISLDY